MRVSLAVFRGDYQANSIMNEPSPWWRPHIHRGPATFSQGANQNDRCGAGVFFGALFTEIDTAILQVSPEMRRISALFRRKCRMKQEPEPSFIYFLP